MNETLLWLCYFLGGGLAFAGTYRWRWRIALAIVAGGLVTTIGWLVIFHFTQEEKQPHWLRLDLSLNVTFGLIFAAAGAALGQRLRNRHKG